MILNAPRRGLACSPVADSPPARLRQLPTTACRWKREDNSGFRRPRVPLGHRSPRLMRGGRGAGRAMTKPPPGQLFELHVRPSVFPPSAIADSWAQFAHDLPSARSPFQRNMPEPGLQRAGPCSRPFPGRSPCPIFTLRPYISCPRFLAIIRRSPTLRQITQT